MGPDASSSCPHCYQFVKDLFEKHKDNPDSPLNFEEVKNLERLKDAFDTGYPKALGKTDIDREVLVDIEDKLEEVNPYEDQSLLPVNDDLRPVEVGYSWGVDEDAAWFSMVAECRNCGHTFEVEQR